MTLMAGAEWSHWGLLVGANVAEIIQERWEFIQRPMGV
jgi:hypothetical protein